MKRKRDNTSIQNFADAEGNLDTFSKVEEATLQYFKEIKAHIDEIADQDQQSAIASNALMEAKG